MKRAFKKMGGLSLISQRLRKATETRTALAQLSLKTVVVKPPDRTL